MSNARVVAFGSQCCRRDTMTGDMDADCENRVNHVCRESRVVHGARVVHAVRDAHVHWHSIQHRRLDRDA